MVLSVRNNAEPGLASFDEAEGLLSPADGPPVEVANPQGISEVVVVCEHAANRVPRALGSLGLAAGALESHIAWDPGAAEVARELARRLDATAVLQRFSRLVHDCNRPSGSAEAMPALTADGALDARRNEPYGPEDGVTHTLKAQALPRGLLNVMIEIRSDLIAERPGQTALTERLAGWLTQALEGPG